LAVEGTPQSMDGAAAGSRARWSLGHKLSVGFVAAFLLMTALVGIVLLGARHRLPVSTSFSTQAPPSFVAAPTPRAPAVTRQPPPLPAPQIRNWSNPVQTTEKPDTKDPALASHILPSGEQGNIAMAAPAAAHAGFAHGGGLHTADDPLSRALIGSNLGGPSFAHLMPHPLYTIPYGTLIPCVLDTAIDSTLVGLVRCHIALKDGVQGQIPGVTLLDEGTWIVGEIRAGLLQGQARLFILWDRATTPEGVEVTLSAPAADDLGRSGVTGGVDNHWLQRYGAAFMFTILGVGPQIVQSAVQGARGNGNFVQYLGPIQSVPAQILSNTLNIPPTLEKNQGDTVMVVVARDIDFSPVYGITEAQP
jgi:type IV secretion system protein VirB10